jgi:flagellar basal body-associated protein FliL
MELKEANEKTSQHKFLTWIIIVFAVALVIIGGLSYYLIFLFPENQVSKLGITNITEKANFINQYRTTSIQLISTFAQILGGIVVVIGIYFAWGNLKVSQATLESNQRNAEKNVEVALANLKSDQEMALKNLELSQTTLEANMKIAQENLKVAQEGQITERFTRAVDQLGAVDKDGNPAIEIRLGGIYALERIANESEKDYWPILEILTAYVRKNSSIKSKHPNELPFDIQAVLNVIGKRKYSFGSGEPNRLDLQRTYLRAAYLKGAHLEGAWLDEAYLVRAILNGAFLKDAYLENAKLILAYLEGAHFERAFLIGTEFMSAQLQGAHFEEAYIEGAFFGEANLEGANFEKAKLIDVHLERAKNLTIDQLSKVKTLYKAELDPELEKPLREKYPALFEEPKDEP